jgi:DNA topoisomerase-3
MRNPKGGKDAGDHPPITPTNRVPSRNEVGGDEWRIYEYVARHFLASISPDAKLIKRSVVFSCGQYEFTLNGSSIEYLGFTEVRLCKI